jgi:uncharacterized lipoprotein YajG
LVRIWLAIALAIVAIAGCDRPVAGTSSEARGVVQQVPPAVDGGVVFMTVVSMRSESNRVDSKVNW